MQSDTAETYDCYLVWCLAAVDVQTRHNNESGKTYRGDDKWRSGNQSDNNEEDT